MSTLNPFKLLALCLEPNGRFSRSQFAMVHLGALAVFGLLALGIEPAGRLVGASEVAAGILAVLAPLAFLPVLLLTFVGGGVRRCRDLGKPAWYVFLGFVPCAGVVPVLYLLLAPGRTDAEAPSESPRVRVAVAAVLVGVVGLGILATIAVQVSDQRAAANETMTVRDIRTLISAQTVYRESNGGLYEGNLECLARPSAVGCAPGLPLG